MRELDLGVQAVVDIAVVLIQMRISVLHVSELPSLQYSLMLDHELEIRCPTQVCVEDMNIVSRDTLLFSQSINRWIS